MKALMSVRGGAGDEHDDAMTKIQTSN